MAVIVDLTLALYVYTIAGIVLAGPLFIKSDRLKRHESYKKKVSVENLLKLKSWRVR